MKKTVLYLLLTLGLYSQAQHDYIPMAVENANWLVYATEHDYLPPFLDYFFGYKIKGDTIINDIHYKKVYYQSYHHRPSNEGPETLPLTFNTLRLFGAIRDDIPNKKVYGILFCLFTYQNEPSDCPCNEEFLMYDFNMQIGDTYTDHCLILPAVGVLQDIQQGYVFGQVRTIQYLVGMSDGAIYEGVGGYSGLFNIVAPHFECWTYPSCLDLVHYCIGTDEECLSDYVALNVAENNLEKLFTIYPNPVKNTLTVKNKLGVNIKSFILYNFLGKEIIKTTNNHIDTSNLNKGMYVLQINTEQGRLTKKIIKK